MDLESAPLLFPLTETKRTGSLKRRNRHEKTNGRGSTGWSLGVFDCRDSDGGHHIRLRLHKVRFKTAV